MNKLTKNPKGEMNQITRKLSPLTKISAKSRPLSHIKSAVGQKKKPWNRRFIYNKIPDYYTIKDKNVMNTKKLRMNSVSKQKNVFDMNYITYQQSKLYQTGKNPFKSFNRTMSGFMSHHSQKMNNDFASNKNFVSPLVNSAFNRNNIMKNSNSNINLNINININDENFNKIKKLWNELCVSPSYRELFIIIYNQLTGEEKEQFFNKEFSELISIKTDIKTLNFYIEQRNKVLKELYEENCKLNSSKYDKSSLIIEISNLIEKLRESTIDVCLAMKKFKNGVNNVSSLAKYNMDILARKSNFDKNYLIKMKGELAFLKEGNAKYCFNLNDDRSPFLLKTSEANVNMINHNNNINNIDKDFFIRIVPLKEETKELISECNYYIYQELIAYQQNIIAQKKIFRCVSPLKNSPYIENKENNFKANTLKNYQINDSNLNIITNKDYQDYKQMNNTNNIFGEKSNKNVQYLINQRFSARPTKDLFSQKLFSGYNIPGEIPNNFFLEDEKVKDEEEEEEYEEKSENETNELNELAEEKKNESENNNKDNSLNEKNNEDSNSKDARINEEKEEQSGEDKINSDNKDNIEEANSNENENNSANPDENSNSNNDNKKNNKDIEKNMDNDGNEYVNQKEDDNNKELNSNQENKNLNNQENKSEEKNNSEKSNNKEEKKQMDKKDDNNVDHKDTKIEEENKNINNINDIKINEIDKK